MFILVNVLMDVGGTAHTYRAMPCRAMVLFLIANYHISMYACFCKAGLTNLSSACCLAAAARAVMRAANDAAFHNGAATVAALHEQSTLLPNCRARLASTRKAHTNEH